MQFRNPYHYQRKPRKVDWGKSLTQQNQKDACDLNKLVKNAIKTGDYTPLVNTGQRKPIFGDFSNVKTFTEAQQLIQATQSQFMELPAKVRTKFKNNPQALAEFIQDENNWPEAEKLGLLTINRPEEGWKPEGPEPEDLPGGDKKADSPQPEAGGNPED